MTRLIKGSLLIFSILLLLTNCRKKEFDAYYGRPDSLEDPIYQQLEAKKNFTHLVALINKGGYKDILGKAGYWTMFAPNDEAFQKFFQEKNISGISAIDSVTAQGIVQYLLVYNAFDQERLDDYQANTGWLPNDAFRRRTAYYSGFYNDTMVNGTQVKAIASNRNGAGNPYVSVDNNNKYIPYFTSTYFAGKRLTASDYNYFFPNTAFTGFNVVDAKVITPNIAAENGMIHEIDRVIVPLPSIEEYLKTKPEYSEFKKLYDRYMVNFLLNADASRRYQLLTGDNKQVYVKVYNSLLAFSPNNENYMKLQDNDGQQNGYTLFVPKNDVLLSYLNSVILEHFKTLENAPPQVIADFLNAHMWQSAVWPSKFNSTSNYLGEEARFNPQADVFDRKILSNALLYGTNKVQEANVFSSVYSKAYLDPKYSIMTRLLDAELKFSINSPSQQFTLFMMSDAAIAAAGYDYNTSLNEWGYTPPGGVRTGGEANRQRLLRILNTSLVQTPKDELNNLAGSGIIDASNGEYIKYNNNQVITGGTLDAARVVTVDSVKTAKNGKVYYLNGLLTFSEVDVGTHIKNLGTATTSGYNYFWKLLESSSAYTAASGEIAGTSTGTFYTVFAPNNAAIQQAVDDGQLPAIITGSVKTPNFNPTLASEREQIARFISYHILNKKSVIPDGKESGGVETLLKNAAGDVLPVTVSSQPGSMQITDMNNRKANVIIAQSNNLSNRTVIHLIDNYLKYNF
jgi:uncharacterized surface protein with fasciclin (FAS1) repeats